MVQPDDDQAVDLRTKLRLVWESRTTDEWIEIGAIGLAVAGVVLVLGWLVIGTFFGPADTDVAWADESYGSTYEAGSSSHGAGDLNGPVPGGGGGGMSGGGGGGGGGQPDQDECDLAHRVRVAGFRAFHYWGSQHMVDRCAMQKAAQSEAPR